MATGRPQSINLVSPFALAIHGKPILVERSALVYSSQMSGTRTIQLDGNILLLPDVLLEVLELIFTIHDTVVFAIHHHSELRLRDIDVLILEEISTGS